MKNKFNIHSQEYMEAMARLMSEALESPEGMRALAAAIAFSFASGDKRVDKTKQPEHWAKLEADLMNDYNKRLHTIFPDAQVNEESYIITPAGLSPVISRTDNTRRRR